MRIEIHTAKKKLTKSYINQMMTASSYELKHGTSLGYVVNTVNGQSRTMLIQHDGKYFIMSMAWTKGSIAVYRKAGKWFQQIKFDTSDECDDWWGEYEKKKAESLNQIYV